MSTYEQRIVAFIDILGFKQLIKESTQNPEKIILIQQILNFLKRNEVTDINNWGIDFIEIEEDAQKKTLTDFEILNDTSCTCFSDSMVVSVLYNKSKVNEIISTLISNLSYIGAILIKFGILLRGGITFGNLIHTNQGILMGQAFIDAYELESKYAKFPRIILSDILLKQLNYPLEKKSNRYPYHQYLKRFEDGCVGFHQIIFYEVMQSSENVSEILEKDLKKIKNVIIDGLDFSFENPEIFMKYKWLSGQFNNLNICNTDIDITLHDVNNINNSHNIHYSNIDKIKNKL